MDEDAIPILWVEEADVAVKWYELLGFTVRCKHRFEPDSPVVEVARGGIRLFLSESTADAAPNTVVYLRVHDVEAIAAEFGMTPAQRGSTREIELRDPDGNRLRVGTPGS